MKRKSNAILMAVALAVYTSVADATPVPSLLGLATNQGSITIGDKTFSNFSFTTSGLTMFDASKVYVDAYIDNGVYFLRYSGDISLVNASSAATADLKLNYTVTAGAGLIDYIDQRYMGSAQGSVAFLAVDESAIGSTAFANSHLQADDICDFPGFDEKGDNLYLVPGQSFVNVTKDIGIGVVGPGSVTLSQVEQSFHQNVPDGGMTVALLGGALVVLQVLRKKLKPKSVGRE